MKRDTLAATSAVAISGMIMLDEDELKALDDFRYTNRMPSRAAAVRELLRRGLAGSWPDSSITGARSEAFGVLRSPSPEAEKD